MSKEPNRMSTQDDPEDCLWLNGGPQDHEIL
jgi:hypothetical protein